MSIDRLLARFSIQTKVLVFIVPLIGGIIAMAALNLYTGSLLGGRLTSTSTSIETLGGFKNAYAGMTNFLHHQNEEKREAVMESLDTQINRVENALTLAENARESEALTGSRALTDELRKDVDSLWALHGEETAIRAEITDTIHEIDELRARLNAVIDTVSKALAEAEDETKSKLRTADQLASDAQTVVKISSAISGAQTPEEAFAAADDVKRDIRKVGKTLRKAIPDTDPALKSLIADNMAGLTDTMKAGVVSQAGMNELQKYANALRPTGIKLQGLAAKVAREATVKFAELDDEIVTGQRTISDSRDFLEALAALELAIVQFAGQPAEAAAEIVAAKLGGVAYSIQTVSMSTGGDVILQAVGETWAGKSVAIPQLMRDLIAMNEARTELFDQASARIDQAWSGVVAFASSQQQGAEAVKDRASGITVTAAIGAGSFGLIAAFLLVTALKGPILRLVNAMRDVASGDLDVDVADSARADEIGEMARALDVFKMNALDKIRVESESTRARDEAETQRHKSDTEKAAADAQLQFAVQSLGSALRNLSQGDLVATIDTPFSGELDALRIDFNESVERMREALLHIRTNAVSIEGDSAQLRSAADDLARRTEQQAASLEQTAAAVDQISAAVHTASERATATDALATETSRDAREGGDVVSRAVDAMSRIEEASSKIDKIIGVIDEIAFQTNLLALNAGVEAARAGEAGKGFAVVAQEVRELAGRSATAAKEIKELISASGEEVRSGVSLVGETGDAITRIIARIEDISNNVSTMAKASREQSTSISEVNAAVSQMDQMTQQNAAMVEETNASSHTLAQEAAALNELVAAFRLDAGYAQPVETDRAA